MKRNSRRVIAFTGNANEKKDVNAYATRLSNNEQFKERNQNNTHLEQYRWFSTYLENRNDDGKKRKYFDSSLISSSQKITLFSEVQVYRWYVGGWRQKKYFCSPGIPRRMSKGNVRNYKWRDCNIVSSCRNLTLDCFFFFLRKGVLFQTKALFAKNFL